MHFNGLVQVGLAVLALAAPVLSTIKCNAASSATVNSTITAAACDGNCVRRILYRTAYASASTGLKHAITAFNALEWCAVDNQDWCPDTIENTLSSVAANAIEALPIDFNDWRSECLLDSLLAVSHSTALLAMQSGENMFNGIDGIDQTSVEMFHQSAWHLSNEEPVVEVPCPLDSYLDPLEAEHKQQQYQYYEDHFNQDSGNDGQNEDGHVDHGLESKEHESQTKGHQNSTTNIQDSHELSDDPEKDTDKNVTDLELLLPILASSPVLLGPFAANAICNSDLILCDAATFRYLRALFLKAKKVVPKSNWLHHLFSKEATKTMGTENSFEEWTKPLVEKPPSDPWYKFKPPAKPVPEGEPVELGRMFQTERFNIMSNTLEQRTLYKLSPEDVMPEQTLLEHAGNPFPELGYEPYYLLDGREGGAPDTWEPAQGYPKGEPQPRLQWQRPEDVRPLKGRWVKQADRYVKVEDGAPAVDSLGEPLIASESGKLVTLEPVASQVKFNGRVQYREFYKANEPTKIGKERADRLIDYRISDKQVRFSKADKKSGKILAGPNPLPSPLPPGSPLPGPAPKIDSPSMHDPDLPGIDLPPSDDPGSQSDKDDKNDGPSEEDGKDDFPDNETTLTPSYTHETTPPASTYPENTQQATSRHDLTDKDEIYTHTEARWPTHTLKSTLLPNNKHKTTLYRSTPTIGSSLAGHIVPTTFSTATESRTSQNISSTTPEILAVIGDYPVFRDMPQQCQVNVSALDDLSHDERKTCDRYIEHLNPGEKRAWIFATFPNLCLPDEDWYIRDLDEAERRYCLHTVQDLTHDEQEAWAIGILPPFCDDYSARLVELDDLPEDQRERCIEEEEARGGSFDDWLYNTILRNVVLRIFGLLLSVTGV